MEVFFANFDNFIRKRAELKIHLNDVSVLKQFDGLDDKESKINFIQKKVYGSENILSFEPDLPTDFIADIKIENTLH